jgi:prepilin-type N-terminal cleavage/methylation domain-containing protein
MVAGLRHRRVPQRAVGRRASGQGRDEGFTLAEVVVSIAVIGVVMSALTTFFVTTMAVTNQQRGRQVAVQLAADATERVRALDSSQLIAGRAQCGGTNICDAPVPGVDLGGMRRWDYRATADPTLPINESRDINGVSYGRFWYLGKCWQQRGAGDDCVNPTGQTTNLVGFFRVVVAVTWRDNRCADHTCLYTTATLVSIA